MGQVMRRWHVILIPIILWAVCFLTLSGGVSPWQLASSVTHTTVSSRVCVCVFVCVLDAFAGACICMSHTEKQHGRKTVKVEKPSGAHSTSSLTLHIPAAIKILMHSAA